MKNKFCNLLIAIILLVSFIPAKATHIVGGDIAVKYLSPNTFEVTLTLFFDCVNGSPAAFDPSINLGVYDKATNAMQQSVVIPFTDSVTLALGDSCYTPPNLCVRKQRYIGTITLPNNINGYYLSWHRCCRNGIITNISNPGGSGNVFYCEVPDPALQDNSPVFVTYPDAYMCAKNINTDVFSATDADNDSLVYTLVPPYDCAATSICTSVNPSPVPPGPGPYGTVTWVAPYSSTNMLGDPAQNINQNGILTTTPPALGLYVMSVQVDEYRNSVKIGAIKRDVEYWVDNCTIPSVSLSGPSPLCVGNSTTLSATGGNNYQWNTGQTTNQIVFSPTSAGTYTFSVYTTVNPNCHIQSNTYTVVVNPGIFPTATTFPDTICLGGSATLNVSGSGSYVWSPASTLNNSTIANPIATPSSTTTYTVTVTNSFGCSNTATVPVVVVGSPSINLGPDQSICLGSGVQLTATGSSGATYSWSPTTGLSCTTCPNPIANPPFSNTYSVFVSFSSGCSASGTIVLTVGSVPFVSAIAPTTICAGDSAVLNANTSNGNPPYTYSWNPPNSLNDPSLQNPTAGPATTTTFVVTVTDAFGCSDDTSTVIYVQTVPSITWAQWGPALTCDGVVVPLKANVSSNGQTVYWDFGDGTTTTTYAPNTDPPPHTYPYGATYNVQVIVYNNPCSDTLDTAMVVNDVTKYINIQQANVFTPNNDNKNDCFRPAICDITAANSGTPCPQDTLTENLISCLEFEVYDRWGIKMFETSDSQKCWDGKTKNGHPAKEGTYYYIAKFKDANIKGFVELLR